MNLEHIFNSFNTHLERLTSTLGGWIAIAFVTIVNFLGGYQLAFTGVVVCVIFDAVFGIAAALKQGNFTRSDLLRETISKVSAYSMALVVFAFVEKLVGMDLPYLVNPVASIICCTELLSIAGNVLIVNPNIMFFSLLKKSLRGEIAQKLKIKEEDVDEALELLDKEKKQKRKRKKI